VNPCSYAKLFADDLKLYIFVTGADSRSLMQSFLDNVFQWSNTWQLTLSPSKCCVLSIGKNPIEYSYNINDVIIKRVSSMIDLGVTIDSKLNFIDHINQMCTVARQRSALILKSFCSRDPVLLFKAFTTFVSPLLEYASCVWNPYLIEHIHKIEGVQKYFTKRLYGFSLLSYVDRLARLNAPSLELRRLHFDLVMYFKIIHGIIDVDMNQYFVISHNTRTRGHNFKLNTSLVNNNKLKTQFKLRAIDAWNNLPYIIVNSSSVDCFKRNLRECNFNSYLH